MLDFVILKIKKMRAPVQLRPLMCRHVQVHHYHQYCRHVKVQLRPMLCKHVHLQHRHGFSYLTMPIMSATSLFFFYLNYLLLHAASPKK